MVLKKDTYFISRHLQKQSYCILYYFELVFLLEEAEVLLLLEELLLEEDFFDVEQELVPEQEQEPYNWLMA